MLSSAWAPGLPRSHLSPAGRDGLGRCHTTEAQGEQPQHRQKPAPEGCSDTATTPGTSPPAKEPDKSL